MQGIPRCPDTLSLNIAVDQFFGICAQISSFKCILHFGQSIYKAISFKFENLTSGSGIYQGISRKQMSSSMSAKLTVQGFPATEFLHCHIPAFTTGKDSGICTGNYATGDSHQWKSSMRNPATYCHENDLAINGCLSNQNFPPVQELLSLFHFPLVLSGVHGLSRRYSRYCQ